MAGEVWQACKRLGALYRFCVRIARPVPIAFVISLLAGIAAAPGATYAPEAVKAAFLHRFASYVQWPSSPPPEAPFVIGMIGGESIENELRTLARTLTIQGRPAEIRRIAGVADLEGIQILYVGEGRLTQARPVLSAATMRAVLVVTDDPAGLARGAVINFLPVERSVRFEVSLTAAERSGLRISSGLLSVAARVEGRPQAQIDCPDPGSYSDGQCVRLLATRSASSTQRARTPDRPARLQGSGGS